MAESFFSPSWYRVAKLQPRLRRHADIHRHHYGGELWYVLQDHATGRFFRFPPIVYHVLGLMDGKLTVQELWEKAADRFGDDAPTQGDMIHVLSQLHAADVLVCDVSPDTAELFSRYKKTDQSTWKLNLRSPMSLRFPLLDPDRFLSRTLRYVRPLFSLFGAILWLVVVAVAGLLAARHWSGLTENITDRVLAAQNLLTMWLVYPFVKALHELGHAYAVKRRDGEVHEMGIMLLVLMPVPYVDASSASAFRDKKQRMMVGAAGMMVELFVSSLALFLWLAVEPGVVRTTAYNILLMGSISTILFNGNPLLRYDGYYILADVLEIPNLAQRSLQYLGYLTKRHLFGLKHLQPPHVAPRERTWLLGYSVAAFVYRLFIYVGIIFFISKKFFIVGVLLGIWAAFGMVIVPLVKKIHYLLFSPELAEKRVRAVTSAGGLSAALLLFIFLVPVPSWTRTEGVVWVPEEALVRAGTSGFVDRVVMTRDSAVKKGDLLIECVDPLLKAEVRVQRAQLNALEARYDAEILTERVKAQVIQEEITHARANLSRSEERFRELTIRSQSDGILVVPRAEDLPGRYLRQGELIAYVLNTDRPMVRVVVSQADVDQIRNRTRRVEVRLAERVSEVIPATVKRTTPGASERLPSTTLGSFGGGAIAMDPRDPQRTKTLEKVFTVDIELAKPSETMYVNDRVYVRFDHGFEPLSLQWYRSLRRLFLRWFNV
jgi:putative peptide zinc metalloprotease protein